MDNVLKSKIENIYYGRFWNLIRDYKFCVKNETFSREEILNCLETEIESVNKMGDFIVKTMGNIKPKKILILGAGSGRMGNEFRKRYSESRIYEVDINRMVVERLKNKCQFDILRKPIIGSIDKIPKVIGKVDLVVGYGVLRYVKNRKKVIREINEALICGGVAFVAEGKMGNLIKEVQNMAYETEIVGKIFVLRKILLPRLTFFYWLLECFENGDPEVVDLFNRYRYEKGEEDIVKTIYMMAGFSRDSIYGYFWKKND